MQATIQLNKKDYLSNIIKGLLLLTNIAFLVYFVVLAVYARPHYDDLHFMWKLQEMSIFDYVKDMYFSRSGRFGGYFLNGIVFSAINAIEASWFFPLLFIAIGILMCCYIATQAFPKANRWWLCNGVVLFYFVYILTNIDFAVVYWLCAMGYYLKFPIALLTFYFINKQQLSIWQWIILILACFTIGAGNEAFSPLLLVFLFINGMYYLQKNKYDFKKTFADKRVRRICIGAIIIIALMVIVVIAPGNYARMTDSEELFHRPTTILEWIKGLIHATSVFHYFTAFYTPYYIVLMALAYLLGAKTKHENHCTNITNTKKQILIGIVVLYLIYTLCTILPSVFLYGNFGIQRNYTHMVFMTMLTFCTLGFLVGYWKSKAERAMKYVSIIGLVVLLSITIINSKMDLPTAKAYAQSVDQRIAYCNKMQCDGYQGTLKVEPLIKPCMIDVKYVLLGLIGKTTSQPMLYYTSENTKAFDEYVYHMKRLYNWDFDIILKE